MDNEKVQHIEKELFVHKEKIKFLEDLKDEHEEEHQEFILQHIINTKKIEYIEKGLLSVLGICISTLLYAILNIVIKNV